MFERFKPAPTDIDSLRSLRRTTATPWSAAGVHAETVLYVPRAGRQPIPIVLLTVRSHTAAFRLDELEQVLAARPAIADSLDAAESYYCVAAVDSINADSVAGDATANVARGQVVLLGPAAPKTLQVLAELSVEHVGDLVAWAHGVAKAEAAGSNDS